MKPDPFNPVNSSNKPSVISTSNQPPKRPAQARTTKTNKQPRVLNRKTAIESDEDSSSSSPRESSASSSHTNPRSSRHEGAQYNLGAMYDNGTGVRKNIKIARYWYRQAASRGDSLAQSALGLIYEKGKGVKKDLAEAAKWYGKAAEQGEPSAIRKLAKLKKSGFE